MVLYYQDRGFSGAQIGFLTGISPLINFVFVPIWTNLADATGRHRLLMSVAMLVGLTLLAFFPFVKSFEAVLILAVFFNIFFAPASTFADSATMFMLADRKDLYGRLRLGGTIGFGISASIAGALVDSLGLKIAFWGGAFCLFLGLIASQGLAYDSTKLEATSRGRVKTLLTSPAWLLFLAVGFAGGFAFAASNTYLYPYMKELGASESLMGLALTLGTVVEIPVLLFIHRAVKRIPSYRLLMIAMVVTGARLLMFAVAQSPEFVLFVQVVNGFAFPVMWVAGVSYVSENAPEGMRTTAQGLFSATVGGLGTAVGGFVGGLLLSSLGGRGLYLVFGVVFFAILAVVTLIRRRYLAE